MRSIHILLLSLIASLSSTHAHAYNKQALMDAYFSVVMIRGYNQNGGMAYGSGVVVADNKVITNCHVLRTTKQPWVSRGEDTYQINSVQADAWHDLCLVTTDNLPFKPVILGDSSSLKRGQEITAIGHSNGVPAPITSVGEVKGLFDGKPGYIIRSSAKFMMGASGSGLFDMDGKLVGINTFKTAGRGGSIHYALPVEWLRNLAQLPESKTFPIEGKAIWEEDENKKPFYMQAAVPESRQDWSGLQTVAQRWTKEDSNNADAWFTLGLASEHLQQFAQAQQAYHHATDIEQNYVEAWFKEGEMAHRQGNENQVSQVADKLAIIDKDLVPMYQQYIACEGKCNTR